MKINSSILIPGVCAAAAAIGIARKNKVLSGVSLFALAIFGLHKVLNYFNSGNSSAGPSRLDSTDSTESRIAQNALITRRLITAYKSTEEGWVMVPPMDQIDWRKGFAVGSGGIGYEGNGRWKVHVSINPEQIEQAIPILVEVLFGQDAPRLGFKLQTEANLSSTHQIGKEVAILFAKTAEEGDLKQIEDCLSLLHNRLRQADISPEKGYVLTPDTMGIIRNAPDGNQVKEKQNLENGKFDRTIPYPYGRNYFHYRDEDCAVIQDETMALIGELEEGAFSVSHVLNLVATDPQNAHNPRKIPDPFLAIRIRDLKDLS